MLLLSFQLAGQRYALDTQDIVEVLPLVRWRPLPEAPPGVAGVFNYHGGLVPLLDLSLLIAGQPASHALDTRIAVVTYKSAAGPRELGLLLERATTLVRREAADFQRQPLQGDTAYLGGLTVEDAGTIQQVELRQLVPEDLWQKLAAAEPVS